MHVGAQVKRLNNNSLSLLALEISNQTLNIKINRSPYFGKIWLRRGKLELTPSILKNTSLVNVLRKEERPLMEFLEKSSFAKKAILGSYQEENLNNKILNLNIAKNIGLMIPNSLVTNCKKELLLFFNKNKPLITKCIFHPPLIVEDENYLFSAGTTIVKESNIEFLSYTFFPTFVQAYINKKFEVRTFFFEENFYSMAIFSQKNKKTRIDYRNYDINSPNRYVPFKLPEIILNMTKQFIEHKNMNSGSIDYIVTEKNEFVFLEINPQGQFDWLSVNCNYYIEKHLAMSLAN